LPGKCGEVKGDDADDDVVLLASLQQVGELIAGDVRAPVLHAQGCLVQKRCVGERD